MGWHLDGRVTAVIGTHTHVPTADARVLPGGSAYVSDIGMTGARGGVIGVRKEQILKRFLTQMPVRFESVWNVAQWVPLRRYWRGPCLRRLRRRRSFVHSGSAADNRAASCADGNS